MMQECNNTRFIVQFYKTCRNSVLYVTANENYLFDHDENATIDADLTISMCVANRMDSDRMCDLCITGELFENANRHFDNLARYYTHALLWLLAIMC